MMRPGNKVASLQLLARSLRRLLDLNWQVLLVGDGDARRQVLAAFETLGTDRVHWLGLRTGEEIVTLMQASDLFAWPAVDEPMGMAMLEAQACALPVVAGDARGVPDIVAHEVAGLLAPEGNEEQFALALRRMLEDRKLRHRLAVRARARVEQRHSIADAGRILNETIEAAIGEAR
jgi:glycosyltransferase involved in cell wall biosynthesis